MPNGSKDKKLQVFSGKYSLLARDQNEAVEHANSIDKNTPKMYLENPKKTKEKSNNLQVFSGKYFLLAYNSDEAVERANSTDKNTPRLYLDKPKKSSHAIFGRSIRLHKQSFPAIMPRMTRLR